MVEFKNRFKYYKKPSQDAAHDFKALFDDMNYGGIAFKADTETTEVERVFCSCGFNDKEYHLACPNCGKEILTVTRAWGERYTHHGTYVDIVPDSGKFKASLVTAKITARSLAKEFDVEVETKPIAILEDGGLDVIEIPSNNLTVSNAGSEQLKSLPVYKYLIQNKLINRDFLSVCKGISFFSYFPQFLSLNQNRYNAILLRLINNSVYLTSITPQLPECSYNELERAGYGWETCDINDEDARQKLTIEELCWMHCIPPELSSVSKYNNSIPTYNFSSYSWRSKDVGDVMKEIRGRDFLKSGFGQYILHRFVTTDMSLHTFNQWLYGKYDFQYNELFEDFVRERSDITSLEYGHMCQYFRNAIGELESRGIHPTPENLRIKRFQIIMNSCKYNLPEYIDLEAEMKNPSQLIIKMAKMMKEAREEDE